MPGPRVKTESPTPVPHSSHLVGRSVPHSSHSTLPQVGRSVGAPAHSTVTTVTLLLRNSDTHPPPLDPASASPSLGSCSEPLGPSRRKISASDASQADGESSHGAVVRSGLACLTTTRLRCECECERTGRQSRSVGPALPALQARKSRSVGRVFSAQCGTWGRRLGKSAGCCVGAPADLRSRSCAHRALAGSSGPAGRFSAAPRGWYGHLRSPRPCRAPRARGIDVRAF